MNCEKQSETFKSAGSGGTDGITSFWNQHIMERFIKANLFVICCVAAGLLLIVYLGAFSCEVSWILEARGDLPYAAYVLCTQYFIVFVATTILIHGLVTGLPWGLFAWSVIIGILSIPELIFVMIMTTQHWGLQSVHGLTELIAYLIRLVINCFALICVIPTGLRWRRESQVLTQLQDLATRLQLQTPPPSVPMLTSKSDSRRSSKRIQNQQSTFENSGYQVTEVSKPVNGGGSQPQGLNVFGSQNEFNASMFALPFIQQQFNPASGINRNGNRTQSLMDLRCTLPGLYNPRYVIENSDEKNGKYFNITIDDLKNNLQDSHKQPASLVGSSSNDPIYCSIEPKQPSPPTQPRGQREPMALPGQQQPPTKLARNCISLENLEGINKVQSDLAAYGHNLLQNYNQQQQYYLAMLGYLQEHQQHSAQFAMNGGIYRRPGSQTSLNPQVLAGNAAMPQQFQRRNSQQLQYYGGFGYANYTNPYITANSKLSLGNESDDYRKYRDVAL
ncbi:uncharacterized protein LOC101898701 isoform X1 [Musca domestica]|uniref:Uncharacterized protein LOC101898701 n=2 Tax=Musca domestica TaxID=7370 RepID=A0A1I8NI30_MUSDO|nr:uncharacterized protein LOC101898701 isoform X1 [Musca domestica]XP_011296150.1 uncharacterized protein LOC101898701 isoform X1 [Musca domestica]XP_011296151.1 uncharacterized protein LOC101898701 isoform X1 [Musca domestica]